MAKAFLQNGSNTIVERVEEFLNDGVDDKNLIDQLKDQLAPLKDMIDNPEGNEGEDALKDLVEEYKDDLDEMEDENEPEEDD